MSPTALYSSIQFTFECRMQGCYFYYRRALWRKWTQLGLSGQDTRWLKLIMSIPMLPPEDILSAFNKLSPTSETRAGSKGDDHVSFYNYTEAYWMEKFLSTSYLDEEFSLCAGCDEMPIACIVRPCGHVVFSLSRVEILQVLWNVLLRKELY